jgi:hypothetical protein
MVGLWFWELRLKIRHVESIIRKNPIRDFEGLLLQQLKLTSTHFFESLKIIIFTQVQNFNHLDGLLND